MNFSEMGLAEYTTYILFQNPVSSFTIDSVKSLANAMLKPNSTSSSVARLPPALEQLPVHRLVLTGNPFVKLAGISGALAVVLGAYGAHSILIKEGLEEKKRIYQTANTYHFFHSIALLGVPLAKHPNVVGSLISLGMILFCGTCYYDVFAEGTQLRKFTPLGGVFLIFGWCCFLL